jgi:hypothetical protein
MAKYLTHLIRAGLKDDTRWDGWCEWNFIPKHTNGVNADNCAYLRHKTHWCVPNGVTCAYFEIWGAGGQGAGSECCSISTPSGSGAYAYKGPIPVKQGDCYYVQAGIHMCCRSERTGIRESWRNAMVIGRGLNNFCAEEGYPGVNTCCPRQYIDSGDSASRYRLFYGQDSGCAKYYGADGGAYGLPGWLMIPADSAMADSATDNQPGQGNTWKYGVPYPGGDWSKRGGHIVGFFCRGVQGLGGENLSNKVGLFWGGSCTCHPYDIEYGMGRPGTWTGAATCCCSPTSNSGKIRITYR